MKSPKDVQIIGQEIAILWQNGEEDYFPMSFLREFSPSAENIGEMDILGKSMAESLMPSDGKGEKPKEIEKQNGDNGKDKDGKGKDGDQDDGAKRNKNRNLKNPEFNP